MRRLPRALILSFVLLCTVVGVVSAAVIERSFPATPGGRLHVDTDFGAITVRSGDGAEVRVRIELDSRAEDRLDVGFENGDDGVTIRGERKGGLISWGSNGRAHFEVVVPRIYDVELETAGGAIEVGGVEGEVRVDTSGGPIRLGRIEGPVWADTSGGDIALEASHGDAELSTSGGSIRIGDVDGRIDAETSGGSIEIARASGEVRAETSGGDIEVREVGGTIEASTSGGDIEASLIEQPRGDCRLETSGGRIVLRLAAGIGLDLAASSGGGTVRVDLPVEVRGRRQRSRLEGTIHGGGPHMRLRSSGGGISVLPL